MIGLGVGITQVAARARRAAVAAGATALPQIAHIIARHSALAIPAQADNTALSTWTDSVAGIVATANAGFEPKYRASVAAAGGKPGVQFDGTLAQALALGTPAALSTALDSGINTTVMVVSGIGPTTYGPVFAAGTGGSAGATQQTLYSINGARAGVGITAQLTRNGGLWPSSAEMLVMVVVNDNTDGHDKQHIYLQGGCISADLLTLGARGLGLYIGGISTTSVKFAGTIHEVFHYDVAIGADEVLTVQKAMCDIYPKAYPWAGIPYFVALPGSSLHTGQQAVSPEFGLPARLAASLGLTYGQYSVCAYGGSTAATNISKYIPRVARMPAIHGRPQKNCYFEYWNSRNSPSIITDTVTIGNMLKASGAKNAIVTSTDYGTAWGFTGSIPRTGAGSFSEYDWVGSGAWDAVVRTDLDANIGVVGCAPTPQSGGGNTYFYTDDVHLTGVSGTCGYQVLAGYESPIVAAM